MTPYVAVRPVGGLGNQLFIYAAGLELSKRHGVELIVRTDWYRENGSRQFELSGIPIDGTISPSSTIFDSSPLARSPLQVQRRLGRLRGVQLVRETGHHYFPEIGDIQPPIELRGYFQSWRYFTGVSQILHEQLVSIDRGDRALTNLDALIGREEQWTALHVRCGDFLSPELKGLHGLTELDYYHRALEIVDRVLGQRPVVVFSDDPRLARQRLQGLRGTFRYFELEPRLRDLDSLVLMSRASAVITANSSFSWWGAWLAEQRGAELIVCPRPWFADASLSEKDLLPLSWISVGREYL